METTTKWSSEKPQGIATNIKYSPEDLRVRTGATNPDGSPKYLTPKIISTAEMDAIVAEIDAKRNASASRIRHTATPIKPKAEAAE